MAAILDNVVPPSSTIISNRRASNFISKTDTLSLRSTNIFIITVKILARSLSNVYCQ